MFNIFYLSFVKQVEFFECKKILSDNLLSFLSLKVILQCTKVLTWLLVNILNQYWKLYKSWSKDFNVNEKFFVRIFVFTEN